MAPKCSAEMLSNVPKCCDVPSGENTMFDKFHSGTSYSAVGRAEFSVIKSTMYIIRCL